MNALTSIPVPINGSIDCKHPVCCAHRSDKATKADGAGGGGGIKAQEKGVARGATKQRMQSSHIPPCHRHMVIATNLSSLFELLHCSIPQTRAERCLEFTAVSGYRMFLGPFG